jgi:hypothetical protein
LICCVQQNKARIFRTGCNPFSPVLRREDKARSTVAKHMAKRLFPKLHIKRHDDTAGTDDRKGRGDPFGPVIGNDRSAIASREPRMAEPMREPVHAAVQIGIAPCLRVSFSESKYCRPVAVPR